MRGCAAAWLVYVALEPTRWPFTSVPSQAAGDASVCDNVSCGTISNVPSNTCPANTVITNDVFCPGTQMSEDTSLDEVCCELDSFPVAAIIAIVIGVLVLVCLAACVYVPWRGCGCVEAPVVIPSLYSPQPMWTRGCVRRTLADTCSCNARR